jgi:8-oxo-dGTP diphosphatase
VCSNKHPSGGRAELARLGWAPELALFSDAFAGPKELAPVLDHLGLRADEVVFVGDTDHDRVCAEAVVRELREETGLEGVCGPLVGWVERFDDGNHFVILDFEVTVLDDQTPVAGDDAAEVAWVPLEDVIDRNLVDGLAEFLHEHGILTVIT